MKCCLSLLLFLIVLAVRPTVSRVYDVSIINPGFETDSDRDGIPDGWVLRHRNAEANKVLPVGGLKSWVRDTKVSHSGDASIRTGITDKNDIGVWYQSGIKIPTGTKHLHLTVWIKSEDVRSSGGIVNLAFQDQSGQAIGNDLNVVTVSSSRDWTLYKGSVVVPGSAVTVSLKCEVWYAFTKCGTYWFDDLHMETADEPFVTKTFYVDDNPLPDATPVEKKIGFVLLGRNYLRVLMKNAVLLDNERITSLEIHACPGEYEPIVLTVHALRSLTNLALCVSDLHGTGGVIKAECIDIRAVRYMPKQGEGRWGLFQETLMEEIPLILEKVALLSVEQNKNQTFWLTVHVPETQKPGIYRGSVTIKVSETRNMKVPLILNVYPFKLLAPPRGITFAMYVRGWNDPEWIAETFADMRAHGLTTIALIVNGPKMEISGGKIHITWNGQSALEQCIAAHPRAGFTEPVMWLMGRDITALCRKIGPLESELFAQAYRDVIAQIVQHGRETDWPEIIFQPVDEAFEWEQRLPEMLRLSQLLKSVPGVRTENDGMNGKWENFSEEAYQLTDVINLHDGPMLDRHKLVDMGAWWKFYARAVNDDKLIWFYNIDITAWHPEPVRFMTGFGLYKSRAHGIVPQAYMLSVNPKNPGAVYDSPASRSNWTMARFPATHDRSGGPTIAYEAFREGIDDYRYLLTLKEVFNKAYRSGDAKIVARANAISGPILVKIESATFNGCTGLAMQGNWTGKCEISPDGHRFVRGDHKIDNNWQFDDYDTLRQQIADGIIQLQSLITK